MGIVSAMYILSIYEIPKFKAAFPDNTGCVA